MSDAIDFERMRTLGDVARYHAEARPNAVAFSFEGRDTTFADFDRHTNQVANALIAAVFTAACALFQSDTPIWAMVE